MFEDSLVESSGKLKTRRGLTTTLSFVLQIVALGIMILIPLIYTEALPKGQLTTFLVAPPPPPPPPPPAAATPVHRVVEVNDQVLRQPTKIPQKVAVIKDEEPPQAAAGVTGGVPGGVPGGSMGGVIGGIIGSARSNLPTVAAPDRVRVSSGVASGNLVNKVPGLSADRAHEPYRRHSRAACSDQQVGQHRELAGCKWTPDVDAVSSGSCAAVEVQTLYAERRAGRGGNHDSGEFQSGWMIFGLAGGLAVNASQRSTRWMTS